MTRVLFSVAFGLVAAEAGQRFLNAHAQRRLLDAWAASVDRGVTRSGWWS